VSDTSSEKKGGSPPADGERAREQGRALSDRRKRNEKRRRAPEFVSRRECQMGGLSQLV